LTQTAANEFKIMFWGTRGSLATPDLECSKAGGNTICVEVECGEHVIVCDAGTGIRSLGGKIIAEKKYKNIDLLLSHAHYDHIEGLPFFAPMFSSDYNVEIRCGKLDGAEDTYEVVSDFMQRPYFPVGPEIFMAKTNFHLLKENQAFDISPQVHVQTLPLVHPGGATAYRIEYNNKSFAYVTDTEHSIGQTNYDIVEFIDGVDVFVYDASLSDEELPQFEGFGHSTWQEGLRMAQSANVKRYFAFHHMPFRCDIDLDEIDQQISAQMPGSGVAREGYSMVL